MKSLRIWIAVLWLATAAVAAQAQDPTATIQRVKASVVAVGTFERTRSPAFAFWGTGFAVGDGSIVATNAHVLPKALDTERREALAIAIATAPGQIEVRAATLRVSDPANDLALINISGNRLAPLALADASELQEGRSLLFTGYPIGSVLGVIPATHRAMVSALTPLAIPQSDAGQLDARTIRRLSGPEMRVIQLDATAYPGSSGSPLYDPQSGAVFGIVNAVFVKGSREAALTQPSGITYAVPANTLAKLLATPK